MSEQNGNSPGAGERHVDTVIVGSGFAGLAMARELLRDGVEDFVVLERGAEVGGTWWFNTYPGCQCDIPSHLYSFSFAPNPGWTRTYPKQREILEYLRRVAAEQGLMPYIRLGTEVRHAAWDEERGLWRLDTSAGPLTARLLLGGQGGLSEPRTPEFPGRDSFEGPSFHSAEWDHDVDLAGKRVAVIGTGASAIQIVPSIQPEVASLTVFQRTPPWIMPHMDRPTTRVERWLYRRFPALQRIPRALAYWLRESVTPGFTRNPDRLKLLEGRALLHMRMQIKDPELREQLRPDYRIGCKRILPSNKWFPAIQRDNVNVVTDGIEAITPRGIRTTAGRELDFDVIVYATGFNVTDIPFADKVAGRGGQTLGDLWDGSPQAYKGSTVPGFPNLFFLLGPNTGLGNNSVVHMIESQVNYVARGLRAMRERGIEVLEVTPEAHRDWNATIQAKMPPTVWTKGGCSSWYIDRNGRNTTMWPDSTRRFRALTREFDLAAYRPVQTGTEREPALATR